MPATLQKYKLLLLAPLLLFLASCEKAPEYPEEPEISFKETETFMSTDALGLVRDSIVIAINFKDGDGNLGLSPADSAAPFDFRNGQNKYSNNYFTELYIKRNGQFEPFTLAFNYNGRFPLLSPDTRNGTLEGEIRYAVVLFFDPSNPDPKIKPGDVIKFKNLHIADRALNESNRVETDEITVFTP